MYTIVLIVCTVHVLVYIHSLVSTNEVQFVCSVGPERTCPWQCPY